MAEPQAKYSPAGFCIYCGSQAGPLSDEHIIPYSLNGNWILPEASCANCAKVTQKFEERCTHESGGMFWGIRARHKLQSRSRSTKKNKVTAVVEKDDGTSAKQVFQADSFPSVAYGLVLPEAGIIRGAQPVNEIAADLVYRIATPGTDFKLPEGKLTLGHFHIGPFMQLLAKIALSFTVANKTDSAVILPMLRDIVLGKCNTETHLIGGGWLGLEAEDNNPYTHALRLKCFTSKHVEGVEFTAMLIDLFGPLELSRYHVVVGQRSIAADFDSGVRYAPGY
jgi:hypothetical protein